MVLTRAVTAAASNPVSSYAEVAACTHSIGPVELGFDTFQ